MRRLLDLNGEANVPAWYTSTLWLIGAYHAGEIARLTKTLGQRSREASYWIALSVGCVLLSLDETASIHETLGSFLDQLVGNPDGAAPVYNWVWLALAVVLTAFLAFLRFLFLLPKAVAFGLVLSGAIFLLGAIGMETLGSLVESGTVSRFPVGLNWNRAIAIEEALEMIGAILFSFVVRADIDATAGLAETAVLARVQGDAATKASRARMSTPETCA